MACYYYIIIERQISYVKYRSHLEREVEPERHILSPVSLFLLQWLYENTRFYLWIPEPGGRLRQ